MPQGPVSDTWERGDPYEQYVGRWSRRVAPLFLSWLRIGPGLQWVDVGCGTGALSAAIVDIGSPASVTGIEPSQGFLETAQSALAGRATFALGTAAAIPLAGGRPMSSFRAWCSTSFPTSPPPSPKCHAC
jgi:SAM-dependent methyltransferase